MSKNLVNGGGNRFSDELKQLALFGLTMKSDEKHIHVFHEYSILPRYTSPNHHMINFDENGGTNPIEKLCTFNKTKGILFVSPARIKDGKTGKYITRFPYTAENKIELALYKIAAKNLDLTKNENNLILLTSVREIQNTLAKAGETKNSPYNYTQVLQSLKIMTQTFYEIKDESGKVEMSFRIISDYTILRGK